MTIPSRAHWASVAQRHYLTEAERLAFKAHELSLLARLNGDYWDQAWAYLRQAESAVRRA